MSDGYGPNQGPPPGASGPGWSQSAAGWPPPGQGPTGGPADGPPPQYGAPPKTARRGRPGLVVLFAVLTEIVIVAAIGNQGLSPHIASFAGDHQNSFIGRSAQAALNLSWRFSPYPNDNAHLWLGMTIGVVSIFVLTALLMLSVLRGAITFGRAFFGTWMAVVVAVGLGGIVAGFIATNYAAPPGTDRVSSGLFFGAGSVRFAAGLGLGLVVALIAGLVAVVTRREAPPVPLAPLPAPGSGSAFFDDSPRQPPPPHDDGARPSLRKDEAQTTAELPVADDRGRQTTQLPRLGVGGSGSGYGQGSTPPSGTSSVDEPTNTGRETTQLPRQFPRPPDDEDLGHQPD